MALRSMCSRAYSVSVRTVARCAPIRGIRAPVRQSRWVPAQRRWAGAAAPAMFCMQCEQTNRNVGCTTVGTCGKTVDVSYLQDLIVDVSKQLGTFAYKTRQLGVADHALESWMLGTLFTTLTNVNFDSEAHVEILKEAFAKLKKAKALYESTAKQRGVAVEQIKITEPEDFSPETLVAYGHAVGVLQRKETEDPDVFSLKELITYGLKGLAAYAEHARVQGYESDVVYEYINEALYKLTLPLAVPEALAIVLKLGEINLTVMELLHNAHTESFGHPEPTQVNCVPKAGHCILVSGHDIHDLHEILKQTAGTGVNVYTHGELLPANTYPVLKKFPHFAGHYGGAWQRQRVEFNKFPGPVVMTTNCLMPPAGSYSNRLFTRNAVGFHGVQHIANNDYSEVIALAKRLPGYTEEAVSALPTKEVTSGFGLNAIASRMDAIVDLIKTGELKHVFVIGGCDGTEHARNYFHDLAHASGKNSAVLTLGCGKFRFLYDNLGTIGNSQVPRVLDVGQCNDAYSAIQVAVALTKTLGLNNPNELPLHFAISWFEQKAIAVFCTMIFLGLRNIHLGPRLPAFITPNVLKVLVSQYGVTPCGNAAQDAEKFLASKNNL